MAQLIKPDYPFIPYELLNTGKVRETFLIRLPDGREYLLIVTSDRISALDYVLKSKIEGKGIVLNQISNSFMKDFIPTSNHIVETDIDAIIKLVPGLARFANILRDRVVLAEKLNMFPLECIFRGYFTGSVVEKYNKDNNGMVLGHNVGFGLKNWDKFPNGPIFTPSDKAPLGRHDTNLTIAEAKKLMEERGFGGWIEKIESDGLRLFNEVSEYALSEDIVIIDTKFECGLDANGNLKYGDEFFTPDSSRFVEKEELKRATEEGRDPISLDKESVRRLVRAVKKQRQAEGRDIEQQELELDEKDIKKTIKTYQEIHNRLIGKDRNPSATKQLQRIYAENDLGR